MTKEVVTYVQENHPVAKQVCTYLQALLAILHRAVTLHLYCLGLSEFSLVAPVFPECSCLHSTCLLAATIDACVQVGCDKSFCGHKSHDSITHKHLTEYTTLVHVSCDARTHIYL